MMATLKELAEKQQLLKNKISIIEDMLVWAYTPESQLKQEHGEEAHDQVMTEIEESWLNPLKEELARLEELEIDDGSDRGKGSQRGAKGKAKAKKA
jgi:hypothetical protein